MDVPLDELSDLSEEQLAVDPRIGMRRMAFEFLLQQEYFGAAAMMIAEFIASIQRIEAAENSEKVARQHYLQTTDAHFGLAASPR